MKALFFTLATLVSTTALASAVKSATACEKYVTCGTYEGAGSAKDENGQVVHEFTERIVVSSKSENQASIVIKIAPEREDGTVYDLTVNFGDDGRMTITSGEDNHLYAQGICKFEVCTYGMIPFRWEGFNESVANSGFLIFKEGRLERHMMTATPRGNHLQVTLLNKK